MAEEQRVFICDCCHRVVARMNDQGQLIIVVRHDGLYHETVLIGHLTTLEKCETINTVAKVLTEYR